MSPRDPTLIWISARKLPRAGGEDWPSRAVFPNLEEARSIDSTINPYVAGCGNHCVTALDDLGEVLAMLPKPEPGREYYLLFTDAQANPLPPDPRLQLLGHDLSDETWTSSVMNCRHWQGRLAPIAARAGRHGLLTFDDAKTAQRWLPEEWPGDPHGRVTIWSLYEYTPGPDERPSSTANLSGWSKQPGAF